MTFAPPRGRLPHPPSLLIALLTVPLFGSCGPKPAAAEDDARGLVVLPPDPSTLIPLPDDVRPRDNFYYFGEVPDGDSVEHVFRLRNEDAKPIAITRVSPGCGCLVPRISYTDSEGVLVRALSNRSGADELIEIPPGMEADLVVSVDTRRISSKNRHKTITTRVTTDSEATPFLTIEVSLLPSAPFQLNPASLKFGRIAMSAGAEMSVDVVPVGESGTRVAGLRTVPDGMEAELEPSQLLGHQIGVLTARWLPPLTLGLHQATIVLDTVTAEGEPARPIEVSSRCTAVLDVQCDSRLVLVQRGVKTDPVVAEAEVYSLLAGQRLRITAAEVEEAHRADLQLQFTPLTPDAEGRSERWALRLSPLGTLPPGVLAGKATVTLDDPQTPRIEVSYAVHVER